jgi:hypothetical protein
MALIGNLHGGTGGTGGTGGAGDPGETGGTGGTGGAGTAGTQWLTGSGTPSDGNGADGDLYLNTDNGDIYQKVGGTWGV